MYEKQADAAPKGSQQHAAWTVGGDLVEVLRGLEDAMRRMDDTLGQVYVVLSRPPMLVERPFPRFDTTTDKGPVERPTDLTAAVDATLKDPINE
jgi:hypothetical protein